MATTQLGSQEEVSQFEASDDLLFSPSELYHENSKLHPSDKMTYITIGVVNTTPEIRQIITRPFRHFRGYQRTELPKEFQPTAQPFEKVLQRRRSIRQFSGEPMRLDQLAKLLYFGDGITAEMKADDGTQWLLRTAPSGGGLYPIELYCMPLRVAGLPSGLYFYDVLEHSLAQLAVKDFTSALLDATGMEQEVSRASACILLAAVMPRVKFKYGERGYRFALLEAGHIAQNILLTAEAEGLGAVPVGGFMDDELNDLLRLDGYQEIVLYLVLVGSGQ